MSRAELVRLFAAVVPELSVESICHVDSGAQVEGAVLDLDPVYGEPSIDLTPVESWTTLTLKLSVRIDPGSLAAALQDGESVPESLRVLAALEARAAKVRRAVQLKHHDGKWNGEIRLERTELAGSGMITLRVARRSNSSISLPGVAAFRGAIIGESRPIALYFDDWEKPYNGPIKYRWEKFRESQDPWIRSRKGDLFLVDPGSVPTVYLNLDIPELQAVLESKARRGAVAVLRDSTATTIAVGVWQQLVIAAVLGAVEASGSGEPPVVPPDWRGAVLSASLRFLYPDDVPADALAKFSREFEDEAQRMMLVARLASTAQGLAGASRVFESSAKKAIDVGESS
ncbi:MAG: hypothetical protein ACK52I_07410 [Pseudomonadota bacterium]